LNDYILPAPGNATGVGGTFAAADLRNAYIGVNSPLQSLNGAGQVVGIVDFASFNATDITSYAGAQVAAAGQPALPAPNVTIVATEGGNPGSNSAIEATGDVELVLAMAPNAQILFFQGNSGITAHLDDIFHAMATSATPLTVASCSLWFSFSDNANQAIGQMAANGVSFFMASGDFGSSTNHSSNNFTNQTLVGGTILNTNTVTGGVYPSNYYAGENTWPSSAGGVLGVSIPDYQVGVSMATNGGSTTSRNYPDVAMVAVGLEVFFNGGFTSFNGTSAGAPLWAGFTALVNQANAQAGGPGKTGFLNPTIYDIGLTSGTADDLYAACFNDIADGGSNGAFNSVAGYDLCMGWGTPKGALINQLSSQTPLTNNQPLTLIRFVITTGQADLGGGLHGSGATATVALQNGDTFTLTLKTTSQANWNNGSINTLDFTIPAIDDQGNPIVPLTPTNGIAGVTINQVQSNPSWSANNWDIAAIQVSLFNPGSPHVCQLNLVGTSVLQDGSTGLVRLSLTAGSSGNGPSSPEFLTGAGSGC
jgi:subtilase family serine protease